MLDSFSRELGEPALGDLAFPKGASPASIEGGATKHGTRAPPALPGASGTAARAPSPAHPPCALFSWPEL